jgi:hypothetical protein
VSFYSRYSEAAELYILKSLSLQSFQSKYISALTFENLALFVECHWRSGGGGGGGGYG